MSTQYLKTQKASASAEQDLVEADILAGKDIYGARQAARLERKQAKRRRAKAHRRESAHMCDPSNYDENGDFIDS